MPLCYLAGRRALIKRYLFFFFFLNLVKFCLVWVIKQFKNVDFPFITCLLTFSDTYKKSTWLRMLRATINVLGQGWDQSPCPAASCWWLCLLLNLTLAWNSGSGPAKPTSSALFSPKAAGSSRQAKKWRFSAVLLSQAKTSLDCKLSSSAAPVMRAVLFADNSITPEGGTGSPCLPAGLGAAGRMLNPWHEATENSRRQARLWGLTIPVPMQAENTLHFSISLWGTAAGTMKEKHTQPLVVSAGGQQLTPLPLSNRAKEDHG